MTLKYKKYYLSLGSNLGDKKEILNAAINRLSYEGNIKKVSSFYETEAVGYTNQQDFINCVVCLESNLFPDKLLQSIKKIEQQLGRKERFQWGPREIDLDIIDYDGPAVHSEKLTIPHPQFENRKFVLVPLKEIEPGFRNRHGKHIDDILENCPDTGFIEQLVFK